LTGLTVTIIEPNISVVKNASVPTPGSRLVTYTLTTANTSPGNATAFELTGVDILPAGMQYV
jgi:uncharacterized repeat protein (TIGR01451 family)